MTDKTYAGFVAMIGRPNVGKSTLMNQLVGQKVAITSDKPQTTRHRIAGIDTQGNQQIIYVDTPGIHSITKRAINRYMNQVAKSVIHDVDIILFLLDRLYWTDEDAMILEMIQAANVPVILILNKVDRAKDKTTLLEPLRELSEKGDFESVIPVSALKGTNVPQLQQVIRQHLPEGPFLFAEDDISDRSLHFMLAELVREKLFRGTGEEVPYALTVDIEKFELKNEIYHISAIIYVERMGQKKIVIGKQGEKLKKVGRAARLDMEKMLEKKVFLQLWVKVKKDWPDNEMLLERLGYTL